QQRLIASLILRANEGAAQLERRRDRVQKAGSGVEEGARVQAFSTRDSRIRKAVRADDLAFFVVPEEQVMVVAIERVEIRGAARAFAYSSKSDLPQPADLLKHSRNLAR